MLGAGAATRLLGLECDDNINSRAWSPLSRVTPHVSRQGSPRPRLPITHDLPRERELRHPKYLNDLGGGGVCSGGFTGPPDTNDTARFVESTGNMSPKRDLGPIPAWQPWHQTPAPHEKLWRYMDFAKFVSLLTTSCLFLARADRLGDHLEGSFPRKSIEARLMRERQVANESEFNKWMRQQVYVNCWHSNDVESAAMWRLYSDSKQAIAVTTTAQRLHDALPDRCYIAKVHYIDFDIETIPDSGYVHAQFFYKRKSFEHEREVRVISLSGATAKSEGMQVDVDLSSTLLEIYVSPESPRWYSNVVTDLVKRCGFDFPVKQSTLDAEALF